MNNSVSSEIYKNFEAELNTISTIETLSKTAIQINDNGESTATLTKVGKEIKLYIDGVFKNETSKDEITVSMFDNNYVLKSHDFIPYSKNDAIFKSHLGKHTYDVYNLRSNGFNSAENAKFKSFYPTPIEQFKDFIYVFETVMYNNGKTRYRYNCLTITVNAISFDIIRVEGETIGYYIFENQQDLPLEEFEECCYAIQQAMGFLTGYMPGGQQYIFNGSEFKYSGYTRPGMKGLYNPVNKNPYAKLFQYEDIAEQYMGKLNVIPMVVFSNIATLIRNDKELSCTIILLMEASSVKSLLLIPSVFAIIIESLSKIIAVSEKGKFLPINDNNLKDNIIKELYEVIDSHESKLSEDAVLKLKRRINEINRPMIKENLNNNEKLTLPFEQLNIKLTIEDMNAIEHRNDLLHGNILLDTGKNLTSKEIADYMAYVSGKLFTLISKLILKYAGYSGFVINHAKFIGEHAEKEAFYDHI